MIPIAIAFFFGALTVTLAYGCLRGAPNLQFVKTPAFALPYTAVVLIIVVFCIRLFAGEEGGVSLGLGILSCVALAPPLSLVVVLFLGEELGSLLTGGRYHGGPKRVGYDRAEIAWNAGDVLEAETYFRKALAQKPEKGRELDFTEVQLAFGNFLHEQQRYAEAEPMWQAALAGTLDPTQQIVTAVRLAEMRKDKLGDTNGALTLLRQTLRKFPRQAESESLRQRLANWSGSSSRGE